MEMIKKEIEEPGSAAKPFQCSICPKSFVREASLQEHILNQHVQDKEYKCKECFKTKQLTKYFATQEILNRHRKRVHGPRRFKCQVCFKTFSEQSNCTTHEKTHSQVHKKRPASNKYKCDLCTKAFSWKPKLHSHMFLAHKQKRDDAHYFKCEFCPKEFFERHLLERHVVDKHVVDKPFECSACLKTFIDQKALDKHTKQHNTEIKYFCDVCPKRFKMKKTLVLHLGVEHKKFFYCHKCYKSFTNKPEFDEHNISDSNQELKCYTCQEEIESECDLKIHMDSHVKEIKTEKIGDTVKIENRMEPLEETAELLKVELTKIQCELCSKTFDHESYFTAHRRKVHPHAVWKCGFEQCFKKFRSYDDLRLHKFTHSETKQFLCHICGKAFPRPDFLKYHEQRHLEDKKFKCSSCPKSYMLIVQLRIHVANNHGGQKPCQCPVENCGTSWANNAQLKDHLVSHETERPFKCSTCKPVRAFKSLKHLKLHEKRDAKNKEPRPDTAVFICSSNSCSFETGSHKEVAIHYGEQHQLPKVRVLSLNNLSSLSFLSVSTKSGNSSGHKLITTEYKCGECSEYFKSASSLSKHIRIHPTQNLFQCTFCSKSFGVKRNLARHVKKMHRQYKCQPVK